MHIGPHSDPFQVFAEWLKEASAVNSIRESTAMAVATLSPAGEIHNRVVLCRDWTSPGFTFFTNYESLKGHDLAANARAGAVFYWDPMFRQVRIDGEVTKTPREVSVAYWRARARGSQISQYISRQSEPLDSREALEAAWEAAEKRFAGQEVPCPEHWGGYILIARRIEFWVGQDNRLHDRFEFEKSDTIWTFRRLSP